MAVLALPDAWFRPTIVPVHVVSVQVVHVSVLDAKYLEAVSALGMEHIHQKLESQILHVLDANIAASIIVCFHSEALKVYQEVGDDNPGT